MKPPSQQYQERMSACADVTLYRIYWWAVSNRNCNTFFITTTMDFWCTGDVKLSFRRGFHAKSVCQHLPNSWGSGCYIFPNTLFLVTRLTTDHRHLPLLDLVTGQACLGLFCHSRPCLIPSQCKLISVDQSSSISAMIRDHSISTTLIESLF